MKFDEFMDNKTSNMLVETNGYENEPYFDEGDEVRVVIPNEGEIPSSADDIVAIEGLENRRGTVDDIIRDEYAERWIYVVDFWHYESSENFYNSELVEL